MKEELNLKREKAVSTFDNLVARTLIDFPLYSVELDKRLQSGEKIETLFPEYFNKMRELYIERLKLYFADSAQIQFLKNSLIALNESLESYRKTTIAVAPETKFYITILIENLSGELAQFLSSYNTTPFTTSEKLPKDQKAKMSPGAFSLFADVMRNQSLTKKNISNNDLATSLSIFTGYSFEHFQNILSAEKLDTKIYSKKHREELKNHLNSVIKYLDTKRL